MNRTRFTTSCPLILRTAALCLCACLVAIALQACSSPKPNATDLSAYPDADMSGYACAQGYDKEYRFVDMTVREIAAEMDAGSTFVLFTGFANCPWCNVELNYLNDAAIDADIDVAYLDLRKNPAWANNLEIDDYDMFVTYFEGWIPVDDDGTVHLYAPHVYFIKDGTIVADHEGTVPTQEEPSDELTSIQKRQLRKFLTDGLAAMV